MAKEKEDKDAKGKGGKGHDAAHDKGAKQAAKPEVQAKPAKQDKGKGEKPAGKPAQKEAAPTQPPRLKVVYQQTIVPALMKQFGYKTVMQVPRVTKITLNMGVGEAKTEAKALDAAMDELSTITGQRAQMRRARKSIAAFKLREGMPIGARITLRGARMYEFLDRLVSIALPRIRDFRGLDPGSFDGRGNYSLGIREQIIFPEINYDDVAAVRGLDIAITTSAADDEGARALLRGLGLPFADDRREQE
jgi:large subunit ribosomal protein L5